MEQEPKNIRYPSEKYESLYSLSSTNVTIGVSYETTENILKSVAIGYTDASTPNYYKFFILFQYDINKTKPNTPKDVFNSFNGYNSSALQYGCEPFGSMLPEENNKVSLSNLKTYANGTGIFYSCGQFGLRPDDRYGNGFRFNMYFESGVHPNTFYLIDDLIFDITNPSQEILTRFEEILQFVERDELIFERQNSGSGGGRGTLDEESTDTDLPSLDTINGINETDNGSFLDTFFTTQYCLTLTQLNSVASAFWSENFFEQLKQKFTNPLDAVISLHMLPFYTTGDIREVYVGSYGTGVNSVLVRHNFIEIDCGSILINEYWQSFLDYSPYTDIEIFLPFIGTKKLDIDDVMGSSLNVKYRIDTLTGTCTAFIKRTLTDKFSKTKSNILYQYTGNCSYTIPVSNNNYGQIINNLFQATVNTGISVASGGSAVVPVLSSSSFLTNNKAQVSKSGNIVCANGFMGQRKPYIIITRPCQCLPKNFQKFKGYQSNINLKLGNLKGFTKIKEIQLNGISATETELKELEVVLKQGVIF